MKKNGGGTVFDLQSPLVVRFVVIWSIASFLLVLFLLWYVLDGQRGKDSSDRAAKVMDQSGAISLTESAAAPTAGYQIEIGGDNPAVAKVVEQVAKHMFLPRGEVKVATIVDAEGLRADFPGVYTYAQNGQKALFYVHGIIIFDPVADKIVDVIRPPGQPQ